MTISILLGHSNTAVTLRYLGISKGEAQDAALAGDIFTADPAATPFGHPLLREFLQPGFLGGQVQPYSLRHTVARWLRKEGVPAWQVAAQLGHSVSAHSMTERYASYSPDCLEGCVSSLDCLFGQLRDSFDFSHKARKAASRSVKREKMAHPRGFEPLTSAFGVDK